MSQFSVSNVPGDTRLCLFLFVGSGRQIPSNDGSGNLTSQPANQAAAEICQAVVESIRKYGALPTKPYQHLMECSFSHMPLLIHSTLRAWKV